MKCAKILRLFIQAIILKFQTKIIAPNFFGQFGSQKTQANAKRRQKEAIEARDEE